MVPFVRVTRDKRGYEHISLMRASGRRGKGGAPRVLYVFRTPPGIKVGREPFDESARRTIEERNPGVHFDWNTLSVILPPPPDVEYWRERRRAEKAAKQARREEVRDEDAQQPPAPAAAVPVAPDEDLDTPGEDIENGEYEAAELLASSAGDETEGDPVSLTQSAADSVVAPATSASSSDAPRPEGQRHRRRRRGGRGRKRHGSPEVSAQVPADSPKVVEDPSKER